MQESSFAYWWFATTVAYVIVLQTLVFWPVQWQNRFVVDDALYFYNRYLTPVIFAILAVYIFLTRKPPQINWRITFYFFVLIVSAVFNQRYKSLFLALDFLFIAYAFMFMSRVKELGTYFLPLYAGVLIWMVTPLAAAAGGVGGGWAEYFWKSDLSYHRFADSRVIFGLVASIATIYAFALRFQSRVTEVALMCITLLMLYLSQSRAALFSAAIVLAYTTSGTERFGYRDLKLNLLNYLLIAVLVAGSWKLFGRHEPLAFSDRNRDEIASIYFELLKNSNLLFGAGQMVDIVMSDGRVTQAHNLVVQWLLNWGLLGVISLGFYLYSFARILSTRAARGAFSVLLLYSLYQPIQGTANIFSPMTLWVLVFVLLSDLFLADEAENFSTPTHGGPRVLG